MTLILCMRVARACATLAAVLTPASASYAQSPQPSKLANAQMAFFPRDLSGIWMERQEAVTFSAEEPPVLPWAIAKFKTAKPDYGPRATPAPQDPILQCLPPGVPRILLIPFPMQIVQAPGEVIMLFESDSS